MGVAQPLSTYSVLGLSHTGLENSHQAPGNLHIEIAILCHVAQSQE